MTQYTDAALTVEVEGGLDLLTVEFPYLTIRQGEAVATPEIQILSSTSFVFTLTQAETARFRVGTAQMQLNFFIGGERGATDIVTINITENLLRRVIPYGG